MVAVSAVSIVRDFEALVELALEPVASAEQLVANLGQIYRKLFTVDLARYDLQEARRSAATLTRQLFVLRLALTERVEGWMQQGIMTLDAQRALRDVLRVSRYAADMLGEITIDHAHLPEGEGTFPTFTGPHDNTLVNARFGEVTFRSGDVMLMRGTAHNSAAIARIGDVDSQFSHIAMIFVDDRGLPWVVEALIEDGAVITPLDVHRRHNYGRALLLRHRDPVLAAAAAQQIREFVAWSLESPRRRILYDFSMELEGRATMFCSKLVRVAFDMASKGKVKLPTFPTRFDMKNQDFFKRIGVTAHETFAPGDIELEPSFETVAEWRDYRLTAALRHQDMIMTKIFEWMDAHGYVFKEDLTIRLIAWFGRLSSFLSSDAKALLASVVPKVPINMTRRTIATIAMLHQTAEPLLHHLQALEACSIDRTGKALHPRVVLAELEAIRKKSGGRVGYLSPSPRWHTMK